MFVIAGLRFLF